jgi:hypothetical protein
MKSLLLLVLLSVSGLSFSAVSNTEEVKEGERAAHYMTGSENCDGTLDFNSSINEGNSVDPTAISN